MGELVLQNITRRLNNTFINKDINLSVEKGQCMCLLGHSGCGKTTLLRIIAGLLRPDSGDVVFQNRSILNTPPHHRNFGLMFQDFALFPHKNVFKNVSFGLEMQRFHKTDITKRVNTILDRVGLRGYAGRSVDELSGGERQRVALARTLAPGPDLLMLDEPLGSLDRRLRDKLLDDLSAIIQKVGVTTIFVTHDQHEAFRAGDLVCVMDSGKIEQIDSPERLYNNPATTKVAAFLGFQNILPAETTRERAATSLGVFSNTFTEKRKEGLCNLLILPDAASLISKSRFSEKEKNKLQGVVKEVAFKGSIMTLLMKTKNGAVFRFDIAGRPQLPPAGNKIFLAIDPARIRLI